MQPNTSAHIALSSLLLILGGIVVPGSAAGMCGCEHRRDVLMELYNATNGAAWTNGNGWGSTACTTPWLGVTCDNNDVTIISMYNNNMQGTLTDSLAQLSQLTKDRHK
jgi:hypothetical protein